MNASASNMNGRAAPRAMPRGLDRTKFPHNTALEASVLGGVILRNATLDDIPDLEVDDFYDHRHKVVFQAMRSLQGQTRPIDTVTLEVEIENAGKLDAIGGVGFLGELALQVPTPDNVVDYAKQIRIASQNRHVIIELASALERAQSWAHEPYELLSETVGQLKRIEEDRPDAAQIKKLKWTMPLLDWLDSDEPSDDDSTDWVIRDIIPRAEAFLWAGEQKGGKTWAAIDVCIAIALGQPWLNKFAHTYRAPRKVMGIFLEDSKVRLQRRMWDLMRPRGATPHHPMLIDNFRISQTPFSLPDARCERELIAEIKAFGAEVVLIDNLTKVMLGDPNKTSDAAAFTRVWMRIIAETGAAIGFLHHTKKQSPGELRKGGDPFELVRGSGDFTASARHILLQLPIRNEGGEKVSELRMRGNLDLDVESLTLGFERRRNLDRWHVWLTDRGPIDQVKTEAATALKESKVEEKRRAAIAEIEKRRGRAITIATSEGFVTQERLAREFGLSSPGSVRAIFQGLVDSGVLRAAGKKGYELADADRQEGMPL